MLSFGTKTPGIAYQYDAGSPLVLIQQTEVCILFSDAIHISVSKASSFVPFSVVSKRDSEIGIYHKISYVKFSHEVN